MLHDRVMLRRNSRAASSMARQVAALPLRWDDRGRLRILMVTSRDSGRWVMPKGWTMDGKTPWRAAEIEAREEAGAIGRISSTPIGTYVYDKRLKGGARVPCLVTLFPLLVSRLEQRWKEAAQRRRRWFSVDAAARAVNEAELARILADLGEDLRERPIDGPLVTLF